MTVGPHEKRMLITGLHTVADIYCLDCEVRPMAVVVGVVPHGGQARFGFWWRRGDGAPGSATTMLTDSIC